MKRLKRIAGGVAVIIAALGVGAAGGWVHTRVAQAYAAPARAGDLAQLLLVSGDHVSVNGCRVTAVRPPALEEEDGDEWWECETTRGPLFVRGAAVAAVLESTR